MSHSIETLLVYLARMPRFYFHLYNGRGVVEDNHGTDHFDVDAARVAAISVLRDVLTRDLVD